MLPSLTTHDTPVVCQELVSFLLALTLQQQRTTEAQPQLEVGLVPVVTAEY